MWGVGTRVRIFIFFLLIPAVVGHVPIYSMITQAVADRFNKACIKIVHERPMNLTGEEELCHWIKYQDSDFSRPYAVITFEEEAMFKRHRDFSCYKSMIVLVAEPTMKEQFATLTWKKRIDKSLWLVFINSSIEDFFKPARLAFSLELIVVSFHENDKATVYDVYRSSYDHPIRIKKIGYWTRETSLRIDKRSLYYRRTDLEGSALRIGMIENWPVTYEVNIDRKKQWAGFYPSIWHEVEWVTNVTSIHVKSVDSTTGSPRRDGSWSGLVGMAVRGDLDVIVSELSVNARRSQILDFLRPLLKSKYQIFFKQPGLVMNWSAVLKPFPRALWDGIVVWAVVSSISLALCSYVTMRLGMEEDSKASFTWRNSAFFTLQALAQQGREDTPRVSACRILIFTSYLVSSVLYPCYSASLISSLTLRPPYRPFDSVLELLQDSTYKLLVPNNTAEHDYFADTNNELLSTIYKRLIHTASPTNMIGRSVARICSGQKYALFGIEAIVTSRLLRPPLPTCIILTMTRPLSTVHMAMAMPKEHPLHPLINFHLQRIIESGMLRRLFEREWPIQSPPLVKKWEQVEPAEVFQMFALLGCGILLSLLVLLCEILYYRWHTFSSYPKYPQRGHVTFYN